MGTVVVLIAGALAMCDLRMDHSAEVLLNGGSADHFMTVSFTGAPGLSTSDYSFKATSSDLSVLAHSDIEISSVIHDDGVFNMTVAMDFSKCAGETDVTIGIQVPSGETLCEGTTNIAVPGACVVCSESGLKEASEEVIVSGRGALSTPFERILENPSMKCRVKTRAISGTNPSMDDLTATIKSGGCLAKTVQIADGEFLVDFEKHTAGKMVAEISWPGFTSDSYFEDEDYFTTATFDVTGKPTAAVTRIEGGDAMNPDGDETVFLHFANAAAASSPSDFSLTVGERVYTATEVTAMECGALVGFRTEPGSGSGLSFSATYKSANVDDGTNGATMSYSKASCDKLQLDVSVAGGDLRDSSIHVARCQSLEVVGEVYPSGCGVVKHTLLDVNGKVLAQTESASFSPDMKAFAVGGPLTHRVEVVGTKTVREFPVIVTKEERLSLDLAAPSKRVQGGTVPVYLSTNLHLSNEECYAGRKVSYEWAVNGQTIKSTGWGQGALIEASSLKSGLNEVTVRATIDGTPITGEARTSIEVAPSSEAVDAKSQGIKSVSVVKTEGATFEKFSVSVTSTSDSSNHVFYYYLVSDGQETLPISLSGQRSASFVVAQPGSYKVLARMFDAKTMDLVDERMSANKITVSSGVAPRSKLAHYKAAGDHVSFQAAALAAVRAISAHTAPSDEDVETVGSIVRDLRDLANEMTPNAGEKAFMSEIVNSVLRLESGFLASEAIVGELVTVLELVHSENDSSILAGTDEAVMVALTHASRHAENFSGEGSTRQRLVSVAGDSNGAVVEAYERLIPIASRASAVGQPCGYAKTIAEDDAVLAVGVACSGHALDIHGDAFELCDSVASSEEPVVLHMAAVRDFIGDSLSADGLSAAGKLLSTGAEFQKSRKPVDDRPGCFKVSMRLPYTMPRAKLVAYQNRIADGVIVGEDASYTLTDVEGKSVVHGNTISASVSNAGLFRVIASRQGTSAGAVALNPALIAGIVVGILGFLVVVVVSSWMVATRVLGRGEETAAATAPPPADAFVERDIYGRSAYMNTNRSGSGDNPVM